MTSNHRQSYRSGWLANLVSTAAALVPFAILSGPTLGQSDPNEFATVINVPPDPAPGGFLVDAQVNLFDGGFIGDSLDVGIPVSSDSHVEFNVFGGNVGSDLDIWAGCTVNVLGGLIGLTNFSTNDANAGSTVNVLGGAFWDLSARQGSQVHISGGTVGNFSASMGSTVSISGGALVSSFGAFPGSNVAFHGAEFALDGSPIANLSAGLTGDKVFSGTLADGSVFILAQDAAASISPNTVTLNSAPLPPPDLNPITVSAGLGPKGLRSGQSLKLQSTGTLSGGFGAVGAELEVEGGTVGPGLRAAYSNLQVSGGMFEGDVELFRGATASFSDGIVNRQLTAFPGSAVDISGGQFTLVVGIGGNINVSGGKMLGLYTNSSFPFESESSVNISGGDPGRIEILTGTVNLLIREAQINGVPLNLLPGEPSLVTERDNKILQAVLADGMLFDIELNEFPGFFDRDLILGGALTVTLVPEPQTAMLFVASLLAMRQRSARTKTLLRRS